MQGSSNISEHAVRFPLRYQFLATLATLVITTIAGLTAIHAYLHARHVRHDLERQLRQVAQTLLDTSFPLNDTVLRQMHGLSGANYVLVDGQGRVEAASKSTAMAPPLNHGAKTSVDELTLAGPISLGGEAFFHMALALDRRAGRRRAGVLHILYPAASYRSARAAAVYPSLIFGGALVLATTAASIWLARRMSQPLHAVAAHAGRLAAGDFDALAVPARNDELRDLVCAINRLADDLSLLRRRIQQRERLALLGQLNAGMVHHLRNDVAGARIALQLHQRACRGADLESLDVALRQLRLTEEHLQRLLSTGQERPLDRRPQRLASLVEETLDLLTPTFRHRGVAFHTAGLKDDAIAAVDAAQLRQALLATLLNAMDAAGDGGKVAITLCADDDEALTISVADSGSGPSREAGDRVFEPFFTTKPEGIGLGLTAARQIAEAHGGRLTFRREQGHTVFEFRLPRNAAASPVTCMTEAQTA